MAAFFGQSVVLNKWGVLQLKTMTRVLVECVLKQPYNYNENYYIAVVCCSYLGHFDTQLDSKCRGILLPADLSEKRSTETWTRA